MDTVPITQLVKASTAGFAGFESAYQPANLACKRGLTSQFSGWSAHLPGSCHLRSSDRTNYLALLLRLR